MHYTIGTERKIADSMINLSTYYLFKIRLCEPNQKGHVEWSVEFIRRKTFSSLHSFSNFKEDQNHLNQSLKRLNERKHYKHKIKQVDLMNKEKAVSKLAVMTPFDITDLVECRADKYSNNKSKSRSWRN